MKVNISTINRVFGDRILVKRLERPERIGGLLVPKSFVNEKRKEQSIWFGVIEKFGLDSCYSEAYDLKEGDIVGISDVANSNSSFEGIDDHEHFWVMEEFVILKDAGRIKAFRNDEPWNLRGEFRDIGLIPIGPYAIVRPYPEDEKIGGVILPHTDKDNLRGEVLSKSMGELKNGEITPLLVNVGSDVLFGKYSGLYARFKQEVFMLVKEEDLIAEFETSKEMAHA